MATLKLNNLVNEIRHYTSPIKKSLGLMFTRKHNRALVFEFRKDRKVPLHMLFVFYAIDVVYLDADKKVIEIKENFRPFTFYNPQKNCRCLLELPQGTINKYDIKEGTSIIF